MPTIRPGKITADQHLSSPVSVSCPSSELFEIFFSGREHFRNYFQNSSDAVVLCRGDNVVIEANPGFCSIFGYSAAETAGAHIDSLISHGDQKVLDEAGGVRRHLRRQGHLQIETIRFHKDGTPIPVEIKGFSFISEGKTFDVAIYKDLSGHRRTEEKLSHLLRLEDLLLSVSQDLVFNEDPISDLRDALESIRAFFGADRSYLFLFDAEAREMRLTYECVSEGIPRLPEQVRKVTPEVRPWWFSRLEEGRPILVGAIDELPLEAVREKAEFREQGAESFLTLPVYMGNSLGGALGLDNIRCRDFWNEDHVKDLSLFADLLGRVLYQDRVHKVLVRDVAERMCLEERARFDEERLSLALEASGNGLWDLDLTTGHVEMSESILRFLGYDLDDISLTREKCKDFIHPDDRGRVERSFADHLKGCSVFFDVSFRVRGRSGDYTWFQVRGKVVGRDTEGLPLRMAGLIADETERHRIGDVLEKSLNRVNHLLEGTIDVISRLVESRDLYTAGHQKRVSQLAGAVAHRMGMPADKVKGIKVAGLLHDIGKVCVPSDILSKPGKLTTLEFDLIRDHPSRGGLILKQVDFPWPVRDIVEQHHERLDGSGYPRGLTGGEILPESRIMAVADVVEAMISHRPYRPARGLAAALEEIRQGRETIYDPAAVDACVAVFEGGFCFDA